MSPPRGEADRELEPALVSTGSLPTAAQVEALVTEAHDALPRGREWRNLERLPGARAGQTQGSSACA